MENEKIDYADVFLRYMMSLHSGAKIALGEIKNPDTGEEEYNLDQAREIINILGMISQKTKGNLNVYEEKMLDNVLSTLRFSYVAKVNKDSSSDEINNPSDFEDSSGNTTKSNSKYETDSSDK